MALVIANSENVFVGAIVWKNDVRHYVYKVNKKTMYVGETPTEELLKRKEMFPKGTTWKEFMKRTHSSQVNFSGWEVSEEEVLKKEKFEKIAEIKKQTKQLMNSNGEKKVELMYRVYKKGKGNYKAPMEIGSSRVIIVMFTNDNWSVLNIDGKQYIYDLENKIYILFKNEIHKNGKEVIFPDRNDLSQLIKKSA